MIMYRYKADPLETARLMEDKILDDSRGGKVMTTRPLTGRSMRKKTTRGLRTKRDTGSVTSKYSGDLHSRYQLSIPCYLIARIFMKVIRWLFLH